MAGTIVLTTAGAWSVPDPLSLAIDVAGALALAGQTVTVDDGSGSFLSWDAATGATGYNVYWGTVGGPPYANVVDVGNVTSADQGDFSGLGTGTRYFNIRSYDGSGLEGPWGEQLIKVVS